MRDRSFRTSPATVFLGAVILGALMAAAAIWVALSQPQIDLPKGAIPTQLGQIQLIDTDLIEEPDQLGSYEAINAFKERQSLIRAELSKQQVPVSYRLPDGSSGSTDAAPRPRTLNDLPGAFWFQVSVGLFSIFMGGWVLGLRRRDWGARMFALTALFVPVFAMSASVYSTRQIALDGGLFTVLSALNMIGAVSFGIALVGLFAMYPKPLFRPRWLLVPLLIYLVVLSMGLTQTGPDGISGMAVLSQMLIALILGVIQWVQSRREPLNRAGLRWFVLVSLVGCSLFIFLSSAPTTLGLAEEGLIPQGYAFGFFNLMHIGLALGVLRYKVFDLDRWSYYIWLWISGLILVFVLDVMLIRLLQTQPWVSLGVGLFLAGFLYFPLRQMLLQRFLERRQASLSGKMAGIVSTALSPSQREHELRWNALLKEIFEPLAPVESIDLDVPTPRFEDNGLALLIPGVDGMGARRLRYAQNGRRLFSRNDLEVAANLVQTHDLAAESRRAYERGVILERDRISRDVHDNIGAQLLSALHSREVTRKDDLVRDSLADLRAIINDGFQAEYPLLALLADLRQETAQRLEAHGVAMTWTGPEGDVDSDARMISFELLNGVRSILREAVSNIVRHAGATKASIVVGLTPAYISLRIEDNGIGIPEGATDAGGNGIPNIRERAFVLSGTSQFRTAKGATSGTTIEVTLPLNFEEIRARRAAE